jgi:hypothetical protein
MNYFILRLAEWGCTRQAIILISLFYAYVIHHTHVVYLNPDWEYFGFSYAPLSSFEVLFMGGLVSIGAMFVPMVLSKPSTIILVLLYIVVYIPTIVISLGLDIDRIDRYGGALGCLVIGYSIVCLATRGSEGKEYDDVALPSDKFSNIIFLLWIALGGILVANFISIMTFSGLEQIYDQRALAKEESSLFLGYAQTYFSNVFSPALIAIGLLKSNWKPVVIGVFGCLITFMIDAQKTVFLLPFVIIALHYALKSKILVFRSTAFFVSILGILTLLAVSLHEQNDVAAFLSTTLVFRTLTIPGLFFSQYYDYFSVEGYTYWSHVRGLNMIIPTPEAYIGDPYWPKLGYIIGDRVQHLPGNNANAHLFADNGIASAGFVGVLVISLILAGWLLLIDKVSKGWDRRYALLVLFSPALFLTNGPLFSILSGYGGIFWTIAFYIHKPNLDTNIARIQPEKATKHLNSEIISSSVINR